MSLNKELLAALQKAGAAVFDADAQLKLAVKSYGERVQAAVGSNPFHLGNDTLFENWKMVARLSKTVAAMEEDLTNVYQLASALSDVEPSLPELVTALSAPAPDAAAETASSPTQDSSLAATDVKIKRKKKAAAAKPGPALAGPLPSNADKLLKHLKYVLKTKGFAPVNQTAVAKATGIPLGSMTAALKRLVAAGRLQANNAGQFKLV
ncbi:hypothetical protein [Rhodoferax sp.]|jgi:hypothetical protein|uniref:hypothetical protein n=1 Tax=Rhodoferax sp. TaxID=50421 RepID=UPI00271EB16F|nr:hypothetical protein [Rhodoferax sp.]MDO9144484.1 hypothetical protein [Rhodoferax sp.]MDP1531374.1 hypothetical protein [Rhodoferax sp.]MDP1944837.1 hypothetical protein [Rhodoferax sp.]MDP2443711.1 hypothetical protein [Rhodoferax sp.]MDP3193403.1 hypothetical protein [Rhodoferax sp.]